MPGSAERAQRRRHSEGRKFIGRECAVNFSVGGSTRPHWTKLKLMGIWQEPAELAFHGLVYLFDLGGIGPLCRVRWCE